MSSSYFCNNRLFVWCRSPRPPVGGVQGERGRRCFPLFFYHFVKCLVSFFFIHSFLSFFFSLFRSSQPQSGCSDSEGSEVREKNWQSKKRKKVFFEKRSFSWELEQFWILVFVGKLETEELLSAQIHLNWVWIIVLNLYNQFALAIPATSR